MATSSTTENDRTNRLRLTLKKWEHDFALQNNGRKPSQDDIRKNSKIASRYREYHKLRSGASQETLPRETRSKNGQCVDNPRPSSESIRPALWANSPRGDRHAHGKFSKFIDTDTIKATPQKNGKVLGIFDSGDCLHFSPRSRGSPRQTRKQPGHTGPVTTSNTPSSRKRGLTSTPSKSTGGNRIGNRDVYRTPSKASKMDDAIAMNQDEELTFGTANSSPYCLDFDTPQALRHRHSLPAMEATSPGTPCLARMLPRQPRLKGLTSILADLRKAEDETFADEEEALRDVEFESNPRTDGIIANKSDDTASSEAGGRGDCSAVSVDGSSKQHENLEILDLSAAGDKNQAEGQSPVPAAETSWKKKGLKRQTRRSILRPIPASIDNQALDGTTSQQSSKRKTKSVPNFQKLKLKHKSKGVGKKFVRGRGFRR